MIQDYFLLAVKSLMHRQLRSWLTILGIVIGIASIITLITISQGLQNTIEEQFESFGANRILISGKGFQGPGSSSQGITSEDAETLQKIPDFEYVSPAIFTPIEVTSGKETSLIFVGGHPVEQWENFYRDIGIKPEIGRFPKLNEKYVVVLGKKAATDLFKKELRINSRIKIKGKDFKVIGIFESFGNPQDDNSIALPIEPLREILNQPDRADVIIAQAKPGSDLEELQKKVERTLERKRDDTNFQVLTASNIAEQINQILGVIQIVLLSIAGISLVVGGIGIMNSMYTSVLERTRDIGIMKAIGAKNSDILKLFLIESGLVGLLGGFLGIVLGSAIALIADKLIENAGYVLSIRLDPITLISGLIFAFIIGMISGALPAIQASRLKPVDALRYE